MKRRTRFHGNFAQLEVIVARTRAPGEWRPLVNGGWQYRCDTGAVLNFWPSTKTVNFQGPEDEKAAFRKAIARVLNGRDAGGLCNGSTLLTLPEPR